MLANGGQIIIQNDAGSSLSQDKYRQWTTDSPEWLQKAHVPHKNIIE